jgi:predicted transcriptional regulator
MLQVKKVWISAKVPEGLKERVQKAAKKKRWSMSIFIEEALLQALL